MAATVLDEVKASLIALVGGMNQADTNAMLGSMEALDRLLASRGRELDPRLTHFLERRSYAKALQFLGGASDVPSGTCGPR
jgi:hypothetical protein